MFDVPVERVSGPLGRSVGLAKAGCGGLFAGLEWRDTMLQEKPVSFSSGRPYRKPTQVGKMKISGA